MICSTLVMTSEHRCFCELAPLYALSVLDASDRAWVEGQIATDSDLALELAELEATVMTLGYASPSAPLAVNLKKRLFQRIGRDLPPTPSAVDASTAFPGAIARLAERAATFAINRDAVRQPHIRWRPYRVPGVRVAPLHIDLVKREVVGLLKAEPGVRYPLHGHADVEEIFMLQGDLLVGTTVYSSGDYLRSAPGSSHAPETRGGCLFFFRTSLNDEFLEDLGRV